MTKIRLIIISLTLAVVGIFALFASFYARGYGFNLKKLKFEPNGILVVKTDPTGAEIYLNTDKGGTSDTNIKLKPGTYDLSIQKEGFIPWHKRVSIQKEEVTEVVVSLFKAAPSLSPITISGAIDPVVSDDYTKIAFFVPSLEDQQNEKIGLWLLETVNLPFGFTKEPRKITDGNLINATWQFSPDGNEILLKTSNGVFLLNTGSFTPQNQRVNIASGYQKTLAEWQKQRKERNENKLKSLAEDLLYVFLNYTKEIAFSPDETKFIYLASGSANLKEGLIKPLPGSSTQKQERHIKGGQIYVYDIKEDRNFLIDTDSSNIVIGNYLPDKPVRRLAWFPNSNNLVLGEEGKITIMDYDNTNRQSVYAGAYISPYVFPFVSSSKLLILTNLGANSSAPNIYSLSLK